MTISDKQVIELYKFTQEHFVDHYDVQTELVDHLANDIEQIWMGKPNLTFQQARSIAFKKFGVFGFMTVVEQKQKAMNKRYKNILWRFVKEWFSLPKIVVTATIFLAFIVVLQFRYAAEILQFGIIGLVLVDLYIHFKRRKKRLKKEKVYLLEAMIFETRIGVSIVSLLNVFNLINLLDVPLHTYSINWIMLVAFIATLLCVILYISIVVIPSKAAELLAETYPEYKIS